MYSLTFRLRVMVP